MTFYQGHSREIILYLLDGATPVTGVPFSDIVVGVRKPTEVGFSPKTVVTEDWLEIGEGYYALTLSEDDTNTLGPIMVRVSGAGFDGEIIEEEVDPVPFGVLASNETCIVSGTVMDLGGDPKWQVPVIFRPLELPTASSGSLISGDPIRTICDAYGNFYVMLLRGQKALVEIDRTAIKHTITIPDQDTANIVDLLPPLE